MCVGTSYWSPKQWAAFFGVHENTARRLISSGQLEHVRVGSAIRIPKYTTPAVKK